MGIPVLFLCLKCKGLWADGSGNDDSRWSSNFAYDAWLIIDLEKTYMINKVVINWEAAYGKAYDILVSVYGK